MKILNCSFFPKGLIRLSALYCKPLVCTIFCFKHCDELDELTSEYTNSFK